MKIDQLGRLLGTELAEETKDLGITIDKTNTGPSNKNFMPSTEVVISTASKG